MKDEADGIDRRGFLNFTWKVLAAGLVVEAGWTTYDVLLPRPAGGFGGTVQAGTESGFPEGLVRYFAGGRFYVTRVDDELLALYQKCPHLGCRVPFCESSGRFECPCHGSIFNLKGEYVAGPAPRGMDTFPVRIEGGQVLVDTGTVVEGSAKGTLTMSGEGVGPSCLESDGAHMGETPAEHMEVSGGGPEEDGGGT
ncbi:MAG TPA: Rieske 2Fe-2S domain-containing protein [Actinomycetota bacterium]|nr:Rieske 2Fe-2S domain-containing protein [Actinomycetota bacterium]